MAKFDLTTKNCEFLDRHLTFPLLEFLLSKDIYDKNVLLNFVLDTVNRTNMIDYTTDIRKRLNLPESMPEELITKRQTVLDKLKELQADIKPLMDCIGEIQARDTMKDSKMLVNVIQSEYNINIDIIQSVYKLAKYMYDCGNYAETSQYLYICLMIMQPNDKNYLNVLWGKLAAEILTINWQSALEDLNRLRDFIDNSSFSNMQLLTQRTWLIHWSVLVFFHHQKGRDLIIENLLYKPVYLNVIQTTCPHILRYLSVAVVVNRGRRNALKDLVKVIQQESYAYKDPITEFLEHLYINFDFEGARLKLHECQEVIVNDFFIYGYLDDFVESARLMIFETFCRIHQCITSEMLADKLNMNQEEAECWIVNLIRNARLDAKIDSKLGYVVMGGQQLSPYQQFVEKIDSLLVRSETLTELVERKTRVKNQGENNWKYY